MFIRWTVQRNKEENWFDKESDLRQDCRWLDKKVKKNGRTENKRRMKGCVIRGKKVPKS